MGHDILVVDDEADIRRLISGVLGDEGYRTRLASNAESALEALRTRRPQLVILDVWLEDSSLDGLELLNRIQMDHPGLPVVMISGHGTIEMAVRAIKHGAYDFVEKPFKIDRLLLVAERAIEQARLRAEVEELRQRGGGTPELIGRSSAIAQVRHQIDRVAPTGSRVLITGPAGSGKEVVARLLHSRSRRANGPFLVVNCAALEPDRIEAELFGEEDGPDKVTRVGILERADGGTVLLDEVADMPMVTQGKILRALQEQAFGRVGGVRPVVSDFRVIASTNRDLGVEIDAGRLREDLYYRLNVVPIMVPGLADRREDIPLLARHFMASAADHHGLAPRVLAEDAMAALQAYAWPGNVRQLRNVVDWLLIMAPGDVTSPIRADMLPVELAPSGPDTLRLDDAAEMMTLPLREARELFEREYLKAQIERFGGNISRTAEFVGMERSALHRKIKGLGIGTERFPRAVGDDD